MIRRLAALVLAAAVFAPLPAHAHDTGTFLYRKWVWHGTYWMYEGAYGCGEGWCDAHGYEHDASGNIYDNRHQGEDWDCRHQVPSIMGHGPVDPDPVVAPVFAAATDAAATVYSALPPVPAVVSLNHPDCPEKSDVGQIVYPILQPIIGSEG